MSDSQRLPDSNLHLSRKNLFVSLNFQAPKLLRVIKMTNMSCVGEILTNINITMTNKDNPS